MHMDTQGLNLFIVDDNKLVVADLNNYLHDKFGISLKITTFNNGEDCLQQLDAETHIVILDYFLNGENGLEILKKIKEKNRKTEVIMLSSNENIALAIQLFRSGAKDYVIKGRSGLKKITKIVYKIITDPINRIVKEFRVLKYMKVFLLIFVVMGLIVFFVLRAID